MRVLHLATSDGGEGGAAKAARAVHRALRLAGHDSQLVVRTRLSDEPGVRQVAPLPPWESRRRRLSRRLRPPAPPPEATATFNFDLPQDFDERSLLGSAQPDVLIVHRITRFLTVPQLARVQRHYDRPLLWLLHDQFPVTGGCHFSHACDGYTRACGRCPQLRSDDPDDLTHRVWERKLEHLTGLPIVFVGQSREALTWAERSSLFSGHRRELIRQPIDAETFRPQARGPARELLGIPPDARVVMLGAGALDAPRKGTQHAVAALRALDDELRSRLWVLAVGKGGEGLAEATGLPTRWLGRLHDDLALAVLYAAADVFVSPSLADSGPMMVAESLLGGRPVVAFSVGLAADLVADPATGRLAPPGDEGALAAGIAEVLRAGPGGEDACRAAAAECAPDRVAAAYERLFASLSPSAGAPPPARPRADAAPPSPAPR
jgi:glycosyltransferase involved in cell wall biosynthesis